MGTACELSIFFLTYMHFNRNSIILKQMRQNCKNIAHVIQYAEPTVCFVLPAMRLFFFKLTFHDIPLKS